MIQYIQPSEVNGVVKAPASKSVVQRVLAAALLANETTCIQGYTPCNDSLAALHIVKQLGAGVEQNGRMLHVKGVSNSNSKKEHLYINCGESGLSARLFAPLSLLFASNVELMGEGSLLNRSFGQIDDVFSQLNIKCVTNKGFLPLHLHGELMPNMHISMDGSGGSQLLSGLLMALPLLNGYSLIEVSNLKSKPYIDLTIEVLAAFGICVENHAYTQFGIKGGQQYKATDYTVEGDWSGASCLLVAGAVSGCIEVCGLKQTSQQADRVIVDVLKAVGANVSVSVNSVKVEKRELLPFEFDATHCPDLFPALAVLAANCKGVSKIKGVSRLANKESNRAAALQAEMAKIGISVTFDDDTMQVHGGVICGGQTLSHNDHRMAMAMAVAGLTSLNRVIIHGAECVNKSYPAFFDDLKSIQTN